MRDRRLATLLLPLAALALSACASDLQRIARHNAGRPLWTLRATGDYGHALYCAEVEANGWFEHPVPQGLDPAQAAKYAELTASADPYRVAVNCYCWSRARREVLAVCPRDPRMLATGESR